MSRSDLRAEAMERDGGECVWCRAVGTPPEIRAGLGPLAMAHFRGIGMGGRGSADVLDNVGMLCEWHHDLLDGRRAAGKRAEVGALLAAYVEVRGYR